MSIRIRDLSILYASFSSLLSSFLQGRYGKGNGQEYLTEYRLEYRRPNLDEWTIYKTKDGTKVRFEYINFRKIENYTIFHNKIKLNIVLKIYNAKISFLHIITYFCIIFFTKQIFLMNENHLYVQSILKKINIHFVHKFVWFSTFFHHFDFLHQQKRCVFQHHLYNTYKTQFPTLIVSDISRIDRFIQDWKTLHKFLKRI